MAQDRTQDIELGITRLEYGDSSRPQRAVLTIETSKSYSGGLVSRASVCWHGYHCRQQMIGVGGSGGDFSQRIKVSERTVKATQKNIDTQHVAAFPPDVISSLTQAAKDHYASVVAAGVDGFKNTYLSEVAI